MHEFVWGRTEDVVPFSLLIELMISIHFFFSFPLIPFLYCTVENWPHKTFFLFQFFLYFSTSLSFLYVLI